MSRNYVFLNMLGFYYVKVRLCFCCVFSPPFPKMNNNYRHVMHIKSNVSCFCRQSSQEKELKLD